MFLSRVVLIFWFGSSFLLFFFCDSVPFVPPWCRFSLFSFLLTSVSRAGRFAVFLCVWTACTSTPLVRLNFVLLSPFDFVLLWFKTSYCYGRCTSSICLSLCVWFTYCWARSEEREFVLKWNPKWICICVDDDSNGLVLRFGLEWCSWEQMICGVNLSVVCSIVVVCMDSEEQLYGLGV